MANQILDNRILVSNGETIANWANLGGTTGQGTQDTEVFIEGAASIGYYQTNTLDGQLYNFGASTDLSDNIFYMWINSTIVPFLNTQVLGGFRMRFAGPTIGNFFEVYIGGKDNWPQAIQGGWVMFVVDIEEAAANPSNTGGTPPATTAIQYVGWAGITDGTMPRMVDNVWVDAVWRLPRGRAGIIVEGSASLNTPWTSEDIATQTNVSGGVFIPAAGGSYKVNTPIQFGQTGSADTLFEDTTNVWLWDNQEFLPNDFYELIFTGSSGGSTQVRFGVTGSTGDDRTGAQGLILSAASGSPRWGIDASDPNTNVVGLYGCQFIHGQDFKLNAAPVETIGTTFTDCVSVTGSESSVYIRNTVVNSFTQDGIPGFMQVTSVGDIKYSTFNFSDGHGVQVVNPLTSSQNSLGNIFNDFGANDTSDAAVVNLTSGSFTASILQGGTVFTVSSSNTTLAEASFTYTVTGAESGSEIRIISTSGVELGGQESVDTGEDFVYAYSYPGYDQDVFVVVHALDYEYVLVDGITLTNGNDSLLIQQTFDRNYLNPA